MDFSQLLLEFLRKNGSANVPGFGEFFLKNTTAFLDKDTQNLLPPGKEIAFRTETRGNEKAFLDFLSSSKNISQNETETAVKKQVNFWNSKLEKEGQLTLENFGNFFLNESKISFRGERTTNLSPDFYGLEEINISEIKNKKSSSPQDISAKSYSFSRTLYWLVPLLITISALTYFAATQPEILFGRKSFPDDLKEKAVVKIKKDTLKKDSVYINSDSLKQDSIKAIATKTPAKKWRSKKYSNTKWKKAKKQQPR